jgi:hypothetical protein
MGNFSRNTFSPQKGYVSVRLQQGVPLVDADWNELSDVTRDESYRSVALTSASGLEPGAFDFLAGAPNNPVVLGGAGIVDGRTFQVGMIVYDTQPWRNPATAAADGVTVIPPLTTPTADRTDICYLDVWEREVGQAEDPNIVNPAIGVETSVRLKREVALRVAEGTQTLPAESAGHAHVPLALFNRPAGSDTVIPQQRENLRRPINVVSLAPVFAPITDDQLSPPAPHPSWTLVWRNNKLLAADFSAGDPVQGALPVALPSGARIREMRVSGQSKALVHGGFISIGLTRHQQRLGPTPQSDQLAGLNVQIIAPGVSLAPFDRSTFVLPNDPRGIVDNTQYSYSLHATSAQGQGAEIHGISVSYTF